jgi:hypothetical protein
MASELERRALALCDAWREYNNDDAGNGKIMGLYKKVRKAEQALRELLEHPASDAEPGDRKNAQ